MNLEKDYGSIPSTESEAYVLGFLGLTTVKANVPAFMHFGGELDSDTQDQLVKIGSELLRGTITPEEYVTKYEKALIAALPKDKQKDVSFDDYTKEQLKMRVFYSHGLHSKDRKALKEERTLVARTLTSQGYLKKYKNSDGTYSYYRSVIKIDEPEYNEILNRTKSGKSESIEENRGIGWEAIAYDLIDWRGGQVSDATLENTKEYWDEKLPGSSPRERERVIQLAQQLNSDGAEDFYEGIEPESKDYMRIRDIMYKGKTREQRMALANNMANKITDRDKAFRRYRAAEEENLHDLALVFFKKFAVLDRTNPTPMLKEDVNLTPSNYKVWNVFGEKDGTTHGVTIILRAQTDPKKYEEDFRKYFSQSLGMSGRTPITIKFEWVASPSEIKKNVVEDLNEAVDNTPKILSFLQANPHATYNAILANLGVDPKSGSAIPVYHQVKKLLASGDIQREQVGRGFLYSVAGTPAAPQPVTPVATATTATPSNPVSKYSIREPNRVLQIWGASKQEALNHIDHELEYTEGLLDLSKKPEHKAKIEQRVADLKAQKDIIEKSSGVKVAAPTKQAAPPAMGGAAVSQAFKKITKLRDQFIALQKTGKFMIGKIYDIAPNTDPKALAKIIQDDPTRGSRYSFTFYGANDRSRSLSVFFAGNKAGKVFIDDKEMKTKQDYAEFLVKKNAKDKKNEALLAQIKNDFYGWRPNAYMKDDIESDSTTVSRMFRGVGDWRNRPGEEDDDSPIWKNEREVTKNFERWVKQHSWSRYVTPFVDPSEKEWATFGVRLKSK